MQIYARHTNKQFWSHNMGRKCNFRKLFNYFFFFLVNQNQSQKTTTIEDKNWCDVPDIRDDGVFVALWKHHESILWISAYNYLVYLIINILKIRDVLSKACVSCDILIVAISKKKEGKGSLFYSRSHCRLIFKVFKSCL